MKRFNLLVVLLLAFAVSASAAPACAVLQDVFAGTPGDPTDFSCSVGPLTFSNFVGIGFGGYVPLTMEIGAITQTGAWIELWFAPIPMMGFPNDMWFYMTVTGPHLGVDLGNAGGVGEQVSITERVCSSPLYPGGVCPEGTQLASLTAVGGEHVSVTYAAGPQSVAYVFKDIGVSSEEGHISSFSQSFEIPEPMTLSLIGAGLLAIGLLRRRKK